MDKIQIYRTFASFISVFGIIVFFRTLIYAINGNLVTEVNEEWEQNLTNTLYALGISLPVAFHIIFIGLIIQKRWLPIKWKRIAWFGIVISGIWLGIALVIKTFVF